jgi:HAMP domain-containing protein
MRLPVPRRAPRLRNVRLSVKLGLSFGAILALTVAIIAVDVRNVEGLEAAHARVTEDVVPRIIAAQKADAAFADLHFAQTAMVLTRGKQREDELDDLAVVEQAIAALRKTDHDSNSAKHVATVAAAIDTWKILDNKLYAAVKRGDTGYAEQTVAGYADAAADNVTEAIGQYITRANQDRAQADARFSTLESTTTRTSMALGALALLVALVLAGGLVRHLGRRLRELSRAAEALAEGDVDHELSVSGRDELGRTAGALTSMV